MVLGEGSLEHRLGATQRDLAESGLESLYELLGREFRLGHGHGATLLHGLAMDAGLHLKRDAALDKDAIRRH